MGHCGPGLLFLLWDHRPFRSAVVRDCFSCFGTTGFSGVLWSGIAFFAVGPHSFPGCCGQIFLSLLWDHRLFRSDVVPACFSCFGTTGFSGHCGLGLLFLLWDHTLFRSDVVPACFLALGPQAFPGRCGPIFLFLLWDHIRHRKQAFFTTPFLFLNLWAVDFRCPFL